jgi:hypothetical protein
MTMPAWLAIFVMAASVAFSSSASAQDRSQWIDFKGTAVETKNHYLLLDWDGQRGLEFGKRDVQPQQFGAVKVRVGAQASRMIRTRGGAEVVTSDPTARDRSTCCVGAVQSCCKDGRVIHACLGAGGCDFGEDSGCD